ncbi:MAG: hypothetical protein QM718_01960 [Steroidobacteraceae bacterium]
MQDQVEAQKLELGHGLVAGVLLLPVTLLLSGSRCGYRMRF